LPLTLAYDEEGSLRFRAVECGLELKHPLVFVVRQCLISDFNHVFLIAITWNLVNGLRDLFILFEIFNFLIIKNWFDLPFINSDFRAFHATSS
jgi:hypothetical protein